MSTVLGGSVWVRRSLFFQFEWYCCCFGSDDRNRGGALSGHLSTATAEREVVEPPLSPVSLPAPHIFSVGGRHVNRGAGTTPASSIGSGGG